ncbi:MAG: two pore domain potassium channel family protein [Acidobacteria bacterium]|nr:two pore domain potassium channel family protein [Acidobacteriota bacterium]
MSALAAVAAVALILWILLDGFEAILLPRRVNRSFRPARMFYRYTWLPWSACARRMRPGKRREHFLSVFGPMSTVALLGLWAVGLMFGFALLKYAWSVPTSAGHPSLLTYFYMTGVTFLTLGYGDITPVTAGGKLLAVIEAGTGFGFLAMVIGYLPVLYQAFSRREAVISLMDARAGSPPTAGQFLERHTLARNHSVMEAQLREWEQWSAVLLETHLSFPVLSYFRSQHDNQSWLATLAAILDASGLLIAAGGQSSYQARLTFAMARHAAVDLALIYRTPPRAAARDRLTAAAEPVLLRSLSALAAVADNAVLGRFREIRAGYEPFLEALGDHFLFSLPPVVPEPPGVDNWQTSAWMKRLGGLANPAAPADHFE